MDLLACAAFRSWLDELFLSLHATVWRPARCALAPTLRHLCGTDQPLPVANVDRLRYSGRAYGDCLSTARRSAVRRRAYRGLADLPCRSEPGFLGYIYTHTEDVCPHYIHPRVPIRWALVITALCFAAWHTPNFASITSWYVAFQLLYTFAGCMFTGLVRQWTGSIIYIIPVHMAVNFIASAG